MAGRVEHMTRLHFSLLLFLTTPLLADVVHLRDGSTLEGSVRIEGETLVVRHRLGEARVLRSQVLRVEDTPDAWDQLESERGVLTQGTAEERYRYGVLAREMGREELARGAFLAVLRLDLEHPGARAALGFVKHEGRWITLEDKQRLEGKVLYQGSWLTLDEKAAREQDARREREARQQAREEAQADARQERAEERAEERAARRHRIQVYEDALARARAERAVEEEYRQRDEYRLLGSGYLLGATLANGVYGGSTTYRFSSSGTGVYGVWPRTSCRQQVYSSGLRLSGSAQGDSWNLKWSFGY